MNARDSILTVLLTLTLAACDGGGNDNGDDAVTTDSTNGDGTGEPSDKPRIVLVHGAFADGSGWQHVIPLLEDDGYHVTAVQNPLTSIDDDVATTRRVIEAEAAIGPVVVVAHSYGGAVITEAAADLPGVKALVYVSAFGPDANEPLADLLHTHGPVPLDEALVPDAAGFLYIDRSRFAEIFCADAPDVEARVMAATQRPVASNIFGEFVDVAAWHDVPSWYLVTRQDNAVIPEVQRFMAERMGATVREIDSSHVAFVSHPDVVVAMIEEAALAPSE
jgi:pimeloyl-ACP methyl ester carboxylesterase